MQQMDQSSTIIMEFIRVGQTLQTTSLVMLESVLQLQQTLLVLVILRSQQLVLPLHIISLQTVTTVTRTTTSMQDHSLVQEQQELQMVRLTILEQVNQQVLILLQEHVMYFLEYVLVFQSQQVKKIFSYVREQVKK